MAPSYNYGITSERRHNVLIPDKFQCCLCNIWKSNQLFSKKEINGYRDAKVNRKPAAEMKCSTCKGGPINERKCLSCYVVKFNEEFSKSARAHGGSGACIACTMWIISAEPGVDVMAAPHTDLYPGEYPDDHAFNNDDSRDGYADPEAGEEDADYDYERYIGTQGWGNAAEEASMAQSTSAATKAPARPVDPDYNNISTGFAKIQVNENAPAAVKGSSSGGPVNGQYMPTFSQTSSIMASVSHVLSAASESGIVLPHLRGKTESSTTTTGATPKPVDSETSSSSNIYTEISKGKGKDIDDGGWEAVDPRRRGAPVPFNAWNNKGEHQVQYKIPSGSEDTSSVLSTTSSSATVIPASALAVRPAQVSAPAVRPAPALPLFNKAPIPTARKSGWVKAVGSRNKGVNYQPPILGGDKRQPTPSEPTESGAGAGSSWDGLL